MKYSVDQSTKGTAKITISLDAQEWKQALTAAYNKTKGKYAVQGFRRGHVPMKVIEQRYGEGVFFEEAFGESFPKYYSEVMDKQPELFPVDRPDVEIGDLNEEGVSFVATVTLKPEIVVADYKGIKYDQVEYNVTDEEVDAEIAAARERASSLNPADDRPVQDGDIVTIDYSGSVNGEKFAGGTAEKQDLTIGSKTFIPGFEEQLVGMKVGEERDIEVKFPENYAPELAGKDAVFHIKLHEIKVKVLPALNAEFAKDVSEFDTFADYRADIAKQLQEKADKRAETEMENALVEKICAGVAEEIPQCMVDSQIDGMIQEMQYRLMYQGAKLEDYLKYTGQTMEQLRESYAERAQKTVKTRLVIEAIVKQEQLEATQEEIDKRIAELAESVKKDFEEYKKTVEEQQLEYIKNDIVTAKLFDLLKEWNPPVGAKKAKTADKKPAAKKPAAAAEDKADKKPATKKTAKKTEK